MSQFPRFHKPSPALIARAARALLLMGALAALALPSGARAQAGAADELRPGDLVRLRIWREPDLSGEFAVDEHGMVVFPKVGPLKVTEQSPAAVKEQLLQGYRASLNHSSIEVTFLRRIQVLGAVRNPGLYPMDPTVTLGDAVALAGGISPQGHQDRVEVFRDGRRLPVRHSLRDRLGDAEVRSGDQIFVPERSWMSRNPGIVAGVVTTAASLLVALTR